MNNIVNMIKKLFAPPVFEGDDEKTRAAELINTVLISIILLATLASIALIFTHALLGQALGTLVVIPFMLIFQIALRRGYVRAVSIITVGLLTLIISILLPVNGTVRNTSITFYILISIIAGLTLGRQAAFWSTGVNSLIVLGVALAEMNELLPPIANESALQQGLVFLVMAIMTVILLNQALGRIQFAMNQLAELNVGLEERVAARTKALTSVAEVSTAASTILDTDKLLQQVVDLAKERFGLYHSHIYLLDETGTSLVLSSGAGAVGQQMVSTGHAIPLNREQSLVARAAREKHGVTVNDVTKAPDFLPNPLLPDTHSELAVPMMVGDKVIGVFDVQSEEVGRFTEADIAVQTTLASQVASAVQNAISFAQIEQQRSQNEMILISAGEGIFGLDKHGNHTFINPAASGMLGYTPEELIGKHSHSIWHHTHADGTPFPAEECPIYFTLNKGNHNQGEEYFIRKDGTGFYVRFSSVPIQEKGRTVGAVVTFADITQQKLDQEFITQRARQQEAINTITQRIRSATTIEEAMQVAARELGHALGKRQTLVTLEPSMMGGQGESTKSELK